MKRANPEAALQRAVAQYLTLVLDKSVVWSAIGHGGGGKVRGAQLKAMGVKAGMPDIYITYDAPQSSTALSFIPTYETEPKTLWIELKSEKGRPSKEQISFATRVRQLGHYCYLCRSLDEVIKTLKDCDVPTKARKVA